MENENERIENLLVLILLNFLKEENLSKKALQLSLAGFSNIEIANFLQTSAQVVANMLSKGRKKRKK
jgi:orotate phosphoribosyltransferase-like protein